MARIKLSELTGHGKPPRDPGTGEYDPPRRRPWASLIKDLNILVGHGFRPSQKVLDALGAAIEKEQEYRAVYTDQMRNVQGAKVDFLRNQQTFELEEARTKPPQEWAPYPFAEPDLSVGARQVRAYDTAAEIAFNDLKHTVNDGFFDRLNEFWAKFVQFEIDPDITLAEHDAKQALAETLAPTIIRVNVNMAQIRGAVAVEMERMKEQQRSEPESLVHFPTLRDLYRGVTEPEETVQTGF